MKAAVATATNERLTLSKAPAAEIAAAAWAAREHAGIPDAAFVVVAVEPGQIAEAEELVAAALELDAA